MTEPSNPPSPDNPDFLPPGQSWDQGAAPGQPPRPAAGPAYPGSGSPYPGATPYPEATPYPGTPPYPPAGPAYPGAGSPYPGSTPYPGTPPYPPVGPAYPGAGTPYPGATPYPGHPSEPAGQPYPPGDTVSGAQGPEKVGRGIAFSLLAVVLGAFLSALIYQWGFIASITSFLMAVAAGWLYRKGAGAAPRKGVLPLIVVIVGGVVVSLLAMLAWSLFTEISAAYPGIPAVDIWSVVGENLFYPPVWEGFASSAFIFVAFAALGTFSMLRQLRRGVALAARTR